MPSSTLAPPLLLGATMVAPHPLSYVALLVLGACHRDPADADDGAATTGDSSGTVATTDGATGESVDTGTPATTGASSGDPTGSSGESSDTGGPPPPAGSCVDTACAFPGAEGFGTDTPGGRGGAVIAVTTLAADGPGSFKAAMLTSGPRIIVFRVSGVIDMAGASIELLAEHSNVTVAGQTSPGGITILNGTLSNYHTDFHDAIFRFLRLRGPDAYDNISLSEAHDFVIDHCDFSGGSDEAFDVTSAHDYTVQWSTIDNSSAAEGAQNYGLLLAYRPTSNISLHHNLSAHHGGRCGAQFHWAGELPEPSGGAALDLRNNIFYNCAFQQIYRADEPPSTGLQFDLVGNYAISGPDTPSDSMLFGISGDLFLDDNVYEGQDMILTPYFEGRLLDASHGFPAVTTTSAAQAYDDVLAWVGAWPRDPMNVRTIAEVEARDGTLGKNDDPLIESGDEPPVDGDGDGMPDAWENEHGLDPADASDGSMIDDGGYSQIERYINELALARVGQG
jgi:pectate lyase